MNRRSFIGNVGSAALGIPLSASLGKCNWMETDLNSPLDVHIFSKHLQFLDIKGAAQMAAELGFDGLDLTVRPKGHVLPENVMTDLPTAINDIKIAGSKCELITTAIADVDSQIDKSVISTAAHSGVKYYRSNWFRYKKDLSMEESLDHYKEKVHRLAELNKEHNIVGCYQNHSGTYIGASVWEIKRILGAADHTHFGVQYDIRHAVAEGGRSWPNGVKLMREHIKTIVLKDFKWGKVDGKWQIVNVPIGEGMVDFVSYFKILKRFGLKPPVCLHLEYPLGGADKGKYDITVDQQVVFDAMKKDLMSIQKLWREAQLD